MLDMVVFGCFFFLYSCLCESDTFVISSQNYEELRIQGLWLDETVKVLKISEIYDLEKFLKDNGDVFGNIEVLTLEKCPVISLDLSCFSEKLVELTISATSLGSIPNLSGFSKLAVLCLSKNNITNFNDSHIPVSIRKIDLSKNILSEFVLTRCLDNLEVLNLDENPLETVALSLLPNLEEIDLGKFPVPISLSSNLKKVKVDSSIEFLNLELLPKNLQMFELETINLQDSVVLYYGVPLSIDSSFFNKNNPIYLNINEIRLKTFNLKDLKFLARFSELKSLKIESLVVDNLLTIDINDLLDFKCLKNLFESPNIQIPKYNFKFLTKLESLDIKIRDKGFLVSRRNFFLPKTMKCLKLTNVNLIADDLFIYHDIKSLTVSDSFIFSYRKDKISKNVVDINLNDCRCMFFVSVGGFSLEETFFAPAVFVGLSTSFNSQFINIIDMPENIKMLELGEGQEIQTSTLQEFKNLEDINICCIYLYKDLKELVFPCLKRLSLLFVDDVSIFKVNKNLESLYLYSPKVKTNLLDFIKELSVLKNLSLINCNLENISFIENLKCLERLDLSSNNIIDISEVKFPRYLKCLKLSNNPLKKLGTSLIDLNFLRIIAMKNKKKRIHRTDSEDNSSESSHQSILDSSSDESMEIEENANPISQKDLVSALPKYLQIIEIGNIYSDTEDIQEKCKFATIL